MAAIQRLRQHARIAFVALALAGGGAACTGADIGSQTENATDSFYNPTEHGVLEFTAGNPAQFTAEQRYHSWTFELSDEAEVSLATELFTQNLGTTMYLYKRGDNGNWGSYIAKSEASDQEPASNIAKSLSKGEYRIKIKALMEFQTGTFSVLGDCSGAGCPTPGGGLCVGEGPDSMPSSGHYGPSCAPILAAIATTPEAPAPAECWSALEERAVAMYKSYWDDVYSYEEMAGGDFEPDTSTVFKPGAGTVVSVDLPGDEDEMTYVFDTEGNLILFYQHNQSPDWGWFCPGEAAEEPDEDCFMEIVYHQEYDTADVTTDSGTATVGDTDQLPVAVAAAVKELGAEAGTEVSFEYSLWNNGYNDGAEVTVSAEGASPTTFVVTGDGEWGLWVVMKTTEEGTSWVCSSH